MSDSPAPVPEEQPPAASSADGCPDDGCPDGGYPDDGYPDGARGSGAVAGPGRAGAHPTVAVVNRVLADLAALTGASLWALSDAEALGALDGMDTALRLAHAVQLSVVREVDGRNLAAAEGAPSTAAYLRGMLKMRPRDAHQTVGLAGDLDTTYTATGQHLTTARINVDQASVIARALNRLPTATPAEAVGTAERILLEAAENLDAADLARLGETLRVTVHDALHPGGPAGDGDDDPSRRRELTLSDESDGTTRIRGRLDAEAAAALRCALDALSKPRPTVAGDPDLRTAAQRRADALVEITTRVLTSGALPVTGGVRPQITVSVTVEALAGRPGAPPAQTGWGLPLPYATLARLCCDPAITRVILNADSVPLDLGRTERLVTPELRRALVVRDRGCTFPSCDRPAEWCEAHHVKPWMDGGTTQLDNLALVCQFHHGLIHHHGWIMQIGPDRRPEFIPPAYLDPEQTPRRNLLRNTYPDLLAGIVPTRRNPHHSPPPHPVRTPGGDTPSADNPADGESTGTGPPGENPARKGPAGNEQAKTTSASVEPPGNLPATHPVAETQPTRDDSTNQRAGDPPQETGPPGHRSGDPPQPDHPPGPTP
jgi:hypothetical protein